MNRNSSFALRKPLMWYSKLRWRSLEHPTRNSWDKYICDIVIPEKAVYLLYLSFKKLNLFLFFYESEIWMLFKAMKIYKFCEPFKCGSSYFSKSCHVTLIIYFGVEIFCLFSQFNFILVKSMSWRKFLFLMFMVNNDI